MISTYKGLIREDACIGHKYVEWDVDYELLPEEPDILSSPTFKIGAKECIWELQGLYGSCYELRLLCMNLSENNEIRCFMGVKRGDGSYHYKIDSELINKKTSIVCTNLFDSFILETLCLNPDGHFSFFVRMNVECTQEGLTTCKHGFADIVTSGEGRIREEECSGHKQVEWDVDYEFQEEDTANSQVFMFGAQRYLLELSTYDHIFEINLFRMGPSSEHYVQCSSGMKRKDGSYDHRFQNIDIGLSEEYDLWQYMGTIYSIDRFVYESLLYPANRTVTFIFRISKEHSQAGAGTCTHGATQMIPSSDGQIREVKCNDHIQVEWDLELPKQYACTVTCPVFEIGGQRYLMELIYFENYIVLSLFTSGRTSKKHVRYFQGAKRRDGTYDHRIQSGVLDHVGDCGIWQLVDATLLVDITDLNSSLLSSDGRVTFFLRMDVDHMRSGIETCSHDMSPRGVGSVTEMESAIYKQVDWSVNYESSSTTVASPSFSIEDQNYLLELSCDDENNRLLKLFRMGPSVNKSVRWWSSVIRKSGFSKQYGSQCNELDLKQTTCVMWQPVGFPLRITEHMGGKEPLIVSVLMSLERKPIALNESISADCQSRQDLNSLLEEDVVFIVDVKEYKIHKAVLKIRVAIFKAMFLHNFVESQTSVVCIKDCDSGVFQLFLDFVYRGKKEIVTSKNCFALFSVADKYLFNELKDLCLLEIKKVIVPKDNFLDIGKFSLMYGDDDDVLKMATRFFSENRHHQN